MEIEYKKQDLLQVGALIMVNILLISSLVDRLGDESVSNLYKVIFTIVTVISLLLCITLIAQYLTRVKTLIIENDVFIIKKPFDKDEFGKDELTFWKETQALAYDDKIKELVLDFRGKQFVLRSPNYKGYSSLINFLETHYQDKVLKLSS